MRALLLTADTPLALTLAADARLTPTDYAADAAYVLSVAYGPLGLFSAFGGRCEGMMCDLLWRRLDAPAVAYAATEYAAPPLLHDFGPGFALLELHPFPGLHATVAYIVHRSHAAVAHIELHNAGAAPMQIGLTSGLRLQLGALHPAAHEPATPLRLDGRCYGAYVATANLRLALLWDEAGPGESDPLPGGMGWTIWRHRVVALEPGARRTLLVGLISGTPPADGYLDDLTADQAEQARALLATDWSAELARHQAASAVMPQIETGDPDWDAAIACTYRLAARCYLSGGAGLPYPSFVFTRTPEQGYPPGGDPQRHAWQWSGQVATEAYVNLPQVVPFAPELGMAVVRNYLHIQRGDGGIDWKPGLAGQRAGWDCIPLLAAAARLLYDYSGDLEFLREAYPGLLRHLDRWFDPANDRDGDGFPEWAHTLQSAFDDNPSFAPWQPWAQGAAIACAECPDLGAYLYREHNDLIAIARLLAAEDGGLEQGDWEDPAGRARALRADITRLTIRAAALRAHVEALWCDEAAIYRYRDRDTHLSPVGGPIGELCGPGEWRVDPPPAGTQARRAVVRISGPAAAAVIVTLRGVGADGAALAETFGRERFSWWGRNLAHASSQAVFRRIDAVAVAGVTGAHTAQFAWIDYTRQDQTQMLPLWAGIPDPARAALLVQRTLTDPARFWRAYGIPNCAANDPAYASDNRNGSGGVWMMWNTMIGEGLCDYGCFGEAWDLFSRIMAAQVRSLREEQCFREAYDADTGAGIGSRDYIWGGVPLHLLTRLHGVQIVTPNRVRLLPSDTQERRIVVRQRGVTVVREGRRAAITWPDGRSEEWEVGAEVVMVVG